MNISSSLLLLMLVLVVFSPHIQDWVTQGGTNWYRPYFVWLVTILFVGWSIRRNQRKLSANKDREL